MKETLFIMGYGVAVAVLGLLEGFLLRALGLGGKWSGIIYAVPANLICCVIAPVGVIASMAAGFIGVFGEMNNPGHVVNKEAFGAWAVPVALVAVVLLGLVRILPLLLMNLKKPFGALLYSVLSSAALAVLFTIMGLVFIAAR